MVYGEKVIKREISMTRYRIDMDFSYDVPLSNVLWFIEKHGGRIVSFVTEGPGGGNPLVRLEFETREAAAACAAEHFPDGKDPEFIDTLIVEVDE